MYLPKDFNETAIVCETRANNKDIKNNEKRIEKYIKVVKIKYKNVIGIIYNMGDIYLYKNSPSLPKESRNKKFYTKNVSENE